MNTPANATIRQQMGAAEWAMLISLALIWGGSFFFIAIAVAELPVLSIVVLRVGLAAAALWAVVAVLGLRPPRSRAVWIGFAGMGLLNNAIPFTLIVWAQQSIGSGLASILNATTPLFTVLVVGALLSDERLTGMRLLGALVGLFGAAVMIGLDVLAGFGSDPAAQIALLGAAVSYAFAGAFGRRFAKMRVDPILVAAGQVSASTLLLAPVALWLEAPWRLDPPSLGVMAAILALALICTAFAYILYFQILARAGATNVVLVTFLAPVSAILLGAAFLGERLGWPQALGIALIGAGLSLIDGRLWRRRPPPAA